MSLEDDKKALIKKYRDEEETEGGESGGKSGQIEFRDFLASDQHLRDDMLPDEKRRLLSVHSDINAANVKKQKDKRDHYKSLKEGKITLAEHRQGLAERGMSSQYRTHFLSQTVQFGSGMVDNQNNPVPSEQIADTNDKDRDELTEQYRLRYSLQNAPKFNPPKLRPT